MSPADSVTLSQNFQFLKAAGGLEWPSRCWQLICYKLQIDRWDANTNKTYTRFSAILLLLNAEEILSLVATLHRWTAAKVAIPKRGSGRVCAVERHRKRQTKRPRSAVDIGASFERNICGDGVPLRFYHLWTRIKLRLTAMLQVANVFEKTTVFCWFQTDPETALFQLRQEGQKLIDPLLADPSSQVGSCFWRWLFGYSKKRMCPLGVSFPHGCYLKVLQRVLAKSLRLVVQ